MGGRKLFEDRRAIAYSGRMGLRLGGRGGDYICLRYSCTNWTAMAPSPTAEATRFTDPERTSPAAKTPGRLVSSRNGGRAMPQDRDCCEGCSRPNEPFRVALNLDRQPIGSRCRPNETKYGRSLYGLPLPGLVVCDLDRL